MVHFVGAGPGAPDLITRRGAGIISSREITSNKILLDTLANQDYTLYEKKL